MYNKEEKKMRDTKTHLESLGAFLILIPFILILTVLPIRNAEVPLWQSLIYIIPIIIGIPLLFCEFKGGKNEKD